MTEVYMNDPLPITVDHALYMSEPLPITVDHALYMSEPLPITVDHALPWVIWSDPLPITVDHGIPNFFPSIKTNITPTYKERNAIFAVSAFLQVPELGADIKIPANLFSGSWLDRGFDKPVTAGFTLSNVDRRFTKGTGDFAGLMSPGLYSPLRKTRKFIKFIVYVIDGDGELLCTKYFPRLVIKERVGGIELTFTCIDEIHHYLNEKVDLPTFSTRELLTRDVDNKKFYGYYLTKKFNRFYNSELLRNASQVQDSEFTFTRDEEEGYDIYEFNSEVDEHYAVESICPIYIGESIQEVCRSVIDSQPEAVQKEYFDVQIKFQDWQTRFNIPVQNATGLSVIKPLITCIPGEYYVKSAGQDKLSLVIQETINVTEYPTSPKYILTPRNSRGDFVVRNSSVKAFNKINIIKPNETSVVAKQIAGTGTVQGGGQ